MGCAPTLRRLCRTRRCSGDRVREETYTDRARALTSRRRQQQHSFKISSVLRSANAARTASDTSDSFRSTSRNDRQRRSMEASSGAHPPALRHCSFVNVTMHSSPAMPASARTPSYHAALCDAISPPVRHRLRHHRCRWSPSSSYREVVAAAGGCFVSAREDVAARHRQERNRRCKV
jgi:hypothetical protein